MASAQGTGQGMAVGSGGATCLRRIRSPTEASARVTGPVVALGYPRASWRRRVR